jgi:hypothetical protein
MRLFVAFADGRNMGGGEEVHIRIHSKIQNEQIHTPNRKLASIAYNRAGVTVEERTSTPSLPSWLIWQWQRQSSVSVSVSVSACSL